MLLVLSKKMNVSASKTIGKDKRTDVVHDFTVNEIRNWSAPYLKSLGMERPQKEERNLGSDIRKRGKIFGVIFEGNEKRN